MDNSPTETRQARRVMLMIIVKKENKRERLAFFYCCRRRRLNSVRQVNGDLPHPVVCIASAQFSTLSAHFSTLSTHGRVWDGFAFLTLPSAAVPWSITLVSPQMERNRGNMQPCALRVWELSPHLPPGSEVRGSVRGPARHCLR